MGLYENLFMHLMLALLDLRFWRTKLGHQNLLDRDNTNHAPSDRILSVFGLHQPTRVDYTCAYCMHTYLLKCVA